MRKQLDDAIPETPLEQRRLLIDVITTAARADRTLEDQSSAFDALRNLVINAPAKLDTLTQQVVAVTARLPESNGFSASCAPNSMPRHWHPSVTTSPRPPSVSALPIPASRTGAN